jgi:asparagine synthase (glutamine-hydrolysing)
MCGITGFLSYPGQVTTEELQTRIRQMSDTLTHRGPDDGGIWTDAEVG